MLGGRWAPQEGWFHGTRITTTYKGSFCQIGNILGGFFFSRRKNKLWKTIGLVSPQKDRAVGFLANGPFHGL